ncbi:MAG: Maf family protein [Alphaproteobacteria bacterium]|nr:Maf family protein [Alphaproteobacteria bacterium]
MGEGKAVLLLASASAARARILREAGLVIDVEPARIDEAEVKRGLAAAGRNPDDAATTLAELKALKVSARYPGIHVIGGDQMLSCEGEWFDKPEDMAAARAQLLKLRGRRHLLHCAVCVARDDGILWHHVERASLHMREFSEAFLDAYLEAAGPEVRHSVGAYQLEGLGAQLFARVDGDHFAILGLPLLPLLDFLRGHGILTR